MTNTLLDHAMAHPPTIADVRDADDGTCCLVRRCRRNDPLVADSDGGEAGADREQQAQPAVAGEADGRQAEVHAKGQHRS